MAPKICIAALLLAAISVGFVYPAYGQIINEAINSNSQSFQLVREKMVVEIPELSGYYYRGMLEGSRFQCIDLRYYNSGDRDQHSEFYLCMFDSAVAASDWVKDFVTGSTASWASGSNGIVGWNGNDMVTIVDDTLFDMLGKKYLEKYPPTSDCAGRCSALLERTQAGGPETNNVTGVPVKHICEDMCGNGICNEAVCPGTGCPCTETANNCAADCSKGSDENATTTIIPTVVSSEGGRLYVNISATSRVEVIRPDDAVYSIAQQNITNVTKIELAVEQQRAIYKIDAVERRAILFIFSVDVQSRITVNAETGQVEKIEKPWWSFLAW